MTDFQLLVSLASRIIQSGQMCLSRSLRDSGLSSAEANVLMFLYLSGDGVRQDDIVSAIEISKAAISRTVASLVRKGYLTAEPSPDDKRVRVIRLTAKARDAQAFIDEQYASMIRAASRGVPSDTVRAAIEVCRKVADNLDAFRAQITGRDSP